MEPITDLKQLTSIPRAIVWFSAAWCGPCQRMDRSELTEAAREAGIPIYYCDETENPDMVDQCRIIQFPTFILFGGVYELSRRMSADTAKVCMWIRKQK